MLRFISTFLLLLQALIPILSVNVVDLRTLKVAKSDKLPAFNKVVEQTDEYYSAAFSFDSIAVYEDDFTADAVYPAIAGFVQSHAPGTARLLHKLERVLSRYMRMALFPTVSI